MDLSEEERAWAVAIKEAMLKEDETIAKSISDFEYVQQAIIAKDKVPKAVKRIKRLYKFRQDHGIPVNTSEITAEKAMEVVQQLDSLTEGTMLAFGKDTQGRYTMFWDYAGFLPAKFVTLEDWNNCFEGFHQMFDAAQPDFAAVRSGMVFLCESKNVGWKIFSLKMEEHAAHLHQDAYPMRIKHMSVLNAPAIFKVMYMLCAPFLAQKVKDAMHLTAQVEDVLQEFPKEILPHNIGGTQTISEMHSVILESLKTRYQNMATFQL